MPPKSFVQLRFPKEFFDLVWRTAGLERQSDDSKDFESEILDEIKQVDFDLECFVWLFH